jgi:hypothetical protein
MYKSIKKSISLIFVMTCVLALSAPVAFAAEISDNINEGIMNEIDKTNDYVYKSILKSQEKADKKVLQSSQNIQKQESLNDSIDKICDELISKTENKVDKLIEKAAEVEIEIERIYIDVKIADRTILVDPCYAH